MDAVLRLKGSTNLDAIQIIKKPGGTIKVSSTPLWAVRCLGVLGGIQVIKKPGDTIKR